MPARVSKFWGGVNPNIKIDKFDKNILDKNNLVNMIVLLKQEDITRSLVMDLFGSFNGESLCHHYDTFEVPAGAFTFTNGKGKKLSNKNPFITTFGIWIFNIFLIQGFDFSFLFGGYINSEINAGKYKDINSTLVYALAEDRISIEKYKKFILYSDFVMPWETFLSPTQSEAILCCTKEVNKLKAKLLKENEEAIKNGDPVVADEITKKLIDFALEYLKDDPALDGYLSGAGGSIPNNFKNMYLMKGAIRNPDPNAKQQFNIATSSFIDGINKDEYALLANSLVGGPYSRAKKTEIGGYWEKLISYALNSVKVDEPGTDCGTKLYSEVVLTKDVISAFMYSYIIKNDGSLEELTSENIDKYRGKKVKVRSALYCKKTKNGKICNHCAGNFFERRGNRNAGLSCPYIATVLKLKSMKAFHDSNVKVSEMDPMKAFGFKQ